MLERARLMALHQAGLYSFNLQFLDRFGLRSSIAREPGPEQDQIQRNVFSSNTNDGASLTQR